VDLNCLVHKCVKRGQRGSDDVLAVVQATCRADGGRAASRERPAPGGSVWNRSSDERVTRLQVVGIDLRRRLGATAAAIAVTEEQVAATLEHIARVRPHDAARLRARAAEARQFAAQERDRAAVYNGTGADAAG